MTGAVVDFLSESWLERAATEIAARHNGSSRFDSVLDIKFEHVYNQSIIQHWQSWRSGRLVDWKASSSVAPDVVIRSDLLGMFKFYRGEHSEISWLETRLPDGATVGIPPTKADLRAHLSVSKPMPGATLSVHVAMPDFPFGPRCIEIAFEDGRIVEQPDDSDPWCWRSGPSALDRGKPGAPLRLSLTLPFHGGVGYLLGAEKFAEIAGRSEIDHDYLAMGCFSGIMHPASVLVSRRNAAAEVGKATTAMVMNQDLPPILQPLMASTTFRHDP